MLNLFSLLALPPCFIIAGLFGFFVGRCGRKLPILDNNLPWAVHRGQQPYLAEDVADLSAQTALPADLGTQAAIDQPQGSWPDAIY